MNQIIQLHGRGREKIVTECELIITIVTRGEKKKKKKHKQRLKSEISRFNYWLSFLGAL